MSKLNSATSWDQILGIGSPPKEDISGQERHPGASAPEKRVLLAQSRPEPQIKEKFGVGGVLMMGRVTCACV